MNAPLTAGSRWRSRSPKRHAGWLVEVRKVGTASVAFERVGHRAPARKRNWLPTTAFLALFAPL